MSSPLLQSIESIHARVAALHTEARRALCGQGDFGVEQVHALSQSLAEMKPILERSSELRKLHPEIAAPLDSYKTQLREVHLTLERIRMMLEAKRSQLLAGRGQLQAMTNWATALGNTR
jgi:hypothetical protein